MKIRAQVGMVLNLDKCIGCHTCSVTCKNVWTSRDGVEYAWFNNVETKPGIGFPKNWEDQEKWNGGWVRKPNGKLVPKQGGRLKILSNIFANPNLPQIDDYYEPFTYDYEHLQNAPRMKTPPTARPISVLTGKKMDKVEWGPNWEDDLAGEFEKRAKDTLFEGIQKDMMGAFRQHLQTRRRRHRAHRSRQMPRLAYVRIRLPVQKNLLQLGERQSRKMYFLLPAHRSGRTHRLLRNLRRPYPLSGRAAV